MKPKRSRGSMGMIGKSYGGLGIVKRKGARPSAFLQDTGHAPAGRVALFRLSSYISMSIRFRNASGARCSPKS